MTEVFTLPKPEFKTPGLDYYGKPERTRKALYPVGPVTETAEGETEQRFVQVYVGHSKDRKQFYATANRVGVGTRPLNPKDGLGGFAFERSFPFNGLGLGRVPVARYSAKLLDEWFALVVERFPEQVAVEPRLQAMFAEDEGEWA